jgi:hypothetical protein
MPVHTQKVMKGTAHATAFLDVQLFMKRWRRLMATGKATASIRRIRRGDQYVELHLDDLQKVFEMAAAYDRIEKVIYDRPDLKPLEKYAFIRRMFLEAELQQGAHHG